MDYLSNDLISIIFNNLEKIKDKNCFSIINNYIYILLVEIILKNYKLNTFLNNDYLILGL